MRVLGAGQPVIDGLFDCSAISRRDAVFIALFIDVKVIAPELDQLGRGPADQRPAAKRDRQRPVSQCGSIRSVELGDFLIANRDLLSQTGLSVI